MGKAPDGVTQALACPLAFNNAKTPRFAMRCLQRGAAVVHLPQASNNAAHGLLLLARRVNFFQLVYPLSTGTNCVLTEWSTKYNNASILFLFSHPL